MVGGSEIALNPLSFYRAVKLLGALQDKQNLARHPFMNDRLTVSKTLLRDVRLMFYKIFGRHKGPKGLDRSEACSIDVDAMYLAFLVGTKDVERANEHLAGLGRSLRRGLQNSGGGGAGEGEGGGGMRSGTSGISHSVVAEYHRLIACYLCQLTDQVHGDQGQGQSQSQSLSQSLSQGLGLSQGQGQGLDPISGVASALNAVKYWLQYGEDKGDPTRYSRIVDGG